MKYYTKKLNQTPIDADLEKIKQIYLRCPEGYEVDHIIPISRGGLHHQDNLQYLTISENRKKGNKLKC
jgi:5-methylcytosine-specific restriction endonuclease McrA